MIGPRHSSYNVYFRTFGDLINLGQVIWSNTSDSGRGETVDPVPNLVIYNLLLLMLLYTCIAVLLAELVKSN